MVVPTGEADAVLAYLRDKGEPAYHVGEIVEGETGVDLVPAESEG